MALKDWKKVRGKLIWRDKKANVVSIYEGANYIVNIENYSGGYLHGHTIPGNSKKSKMMAIKRAKEYMRKH